MFWNQFGNFINLDPDPVSSNFVDPDPHTINPDPHHWYIYYRDEGVNAYGKMKRWKEGKKENMNEWIKSIRSVNASDRQDKSVIQQTWSVSISGLCATGLEFNPSSPKVRLPLFSRSTLIDSYITTESYNKYR